MRSANNSFSTSSLTELEPFVPEKMVQYPTRTEAVLKANDRLSLHKIFESSILSGSSELEEETE